MDELKQAIREARSVIIILPDHSSDKDFLAALQIQKITPEKIHLIAPAEKEQNWSDTFDIKPVKKEFAITIDTALSPVEELRYEKGDSSLTIFLTHKHAFNQAALSFAEHLPPADLIVTMGFSTLADAEHYLELLPRQGTARHIWLENGEGEKAKLPLPSLALMGRLMVRSRHDPDLNVLWSFITRDDFTKAQTTPEDIPVVVRTLVKLTSPPSAIVTFWQYGERRTQGVVWSENKTFIATLASKLHVEQSDSIVPLPEFDNFIEAETETRKLLHGTLMG